MGRCPISSQQHAKTSRLGDKTAQVWSKNRASGCPNTFKERHLHRFRHGVTTCLNASLIDIVTDYDQRSGVPESNFCQDYQGLSLRKRRKGGFVAQQMLVLRICESANLRICPEGMKRFTFHSFCAVLFGGAPAYDAKAYLVFQIRHGLQRRKERRSEDKSEQETQA